MDLRFDGDHLFTTYLEPEGFVKRGGQNEPDWLVANEERLRLFASGAKTIYDKQVCREALVNYQFNQAKKNGYQGVKTVAQSSIGSFNNTGVMRLGQ